MEKTCLVCTLPFTSWRGSVTCSIECRKAHRLVKKREYNARHLSKPDKRQQARDRDLKRDHDAKALRNLSNISLVTPNFMADMRAKAAREMRAAALLPEMRRCVICDTPFIPRQNVKTCSEECRCIRLEETTGKIGAYEYRSRTPVAKRVTQNALNDERRAAHQLVKEIEEKGLSALL